MNPEIQQGAEVFVNLFASKTGFQLNAGQIAEAVTQLIAAAEQICNAWPDAKKAGQAEADKITDMASAEKYNKEH